MTYQECLNYLFAQLPMFSRIGEAAYKKDIGNTIALCEALGHPQQQFKCIHIAGTNGKGSTSHMLAAILQENGYKTGLYTSPHLFDFGERIRINGQMIDESFVIDFTQRTKSLCQDIQPSFFELTVAMAFCYFAQEKVDIAVIETGLGGRLDSTNIIHPELSVVTNIGMDHMNLLGNTIEQIAFEKAGIIKTNTPVVIGERLPQTEPVFINKATEVSAPILFAEDIINIRKQHATDAHVTYKVRRKNEPLPEIYTIDLLGDYQMKNLRTVLAAVDILNDSGWNLKQDHIHQALKNVMHITGLKGRWELLSRNPLVIADVGHNKDGIEQIIQQLHHDYPNAKCHFVLGFVRDKDLSGVLRLFPADASYYFTQAHIERALPAAELKELAYANGLEGEIYEDVNAALNAAKNVVDQKDVMMICGSFFIIAELDKNQVR